MTATMEIADPYYRDGAKVNRDKVEELLENSPFIKRADTLAALANEIDVDAPVFLDTVDRYNKACDQGLEREPEFERRLERDENPLTYGLGLSAIDGE